MTVEGVAKVLYISLTSAADSGTFDESWREEKVLDVCNKLDFKDQIEKSLMKVS